MAVPASRAVAWYGEAMRLFKRGPVVLSALGALTIVAQVAIDLWPDAGPLRAVKKLKFARPIRPGDALVLRLTRTGAGVAFELSRRGDACTTGVLELGP